MGLLDAAKAGMRAAPKAKNVVQKAVTTAEHSLVPAAAHAAETAATHMPHNTIDYRKLKSPTDALPPWKRRLVSEGKKPVGVSADHLPPQQAATTAAAPSAANPVDSQLAERRKHIAAGGTPTSTWQRALSGK